MNPELARNLLVKRGCVLNDPASDRSIEELRRLIGNTPSWPAFHAIYRCFNGFYNIDQESMVKIWNIDEIVSFSPDYAINDEMIAFSDIQFNAEIMHISRKNDVAVYAISGDVIASSMSDFLEQVVENRVRFT
jgi:hypothetical protein